MTEFQAFVPTSYVLRINIKNFKEEKGRVPKAKKDPTPKLLLIKVLVRSHKTFFYSIG